MRDTLLREGWRAIILSLIFALALTGLSMVYRALFAAIGGAWPNAAALILLAALAGLWLKWLCENRSELVEF